MSIADTIQELATDIGIAYDEVQTKGGTLPQNKNTNNLATAIGTIPTGITPTGTVQITQNGTYDVTDKASAVVAVQNDATGMLQGTITSLTNTEATSVIKQFGTGTFQNLEYLNLPNCTRMNGVGTLQSCGKLVKAFLPSLTYIQESNIFDSCSKLEVVDLGSPPNIWSASFASCTNFTVLVLRKANAITALGNTNAFVSTPFRNGTGGTAYVPYARLSGYQNGTNWSSLESTTFAAIEENLATLSTLGVDITDYYDIVTELPTSDIATDKVYLIETQTQGTYEQWFYGSGSWVQLADITLGGS